MVLPVVFVCSGLCFTVLSCLRLIFNFVFVLSREFGCLRLFHDVLFCSGSFVSIQVVGPLRFFHVFVCCIFS